MTPYYSPAPLGNNTHATQSGQDNYEIAFEILYITLVTEHFLMFQYAREVKIKNLSLKKVETFMEIFNKPIWETAGTKLLSINESILTLIIQVVFESIFFSFSEPLLFLERRFNLQV